MDEVTPVNIYGIDSSGNAKLLKTEPDTSPACSAETQAKIDEKVVELVKKQHEKAVRILTENREKLDELAAHLYEKETITGEEFMAILGA